VGNWAGRLAAMRMVALATLCLGVGSSPGAAPTLAMAPGRHAPPRDDGIVLAALGAHGSGPQVRLVEPGPQHAPTDSTIRLQFSRRMDMGSVLRSFSIEPAVDGVLEWPDDRTLVFHPSAPLAYRSTYRVTVGGVAAGARVLPALATLAFATVWPPPVVSIPFTLTFDDCGTPDQIQAILSALADRSLHAIFFPTGQCRDQLPWLVRTLLAAGHRVCNHTYSHPDLTKLSSAAIGSEIERGVSVDCNLFRPPYGAMDRGGRVAAVAASLGYRIQLWDVDTRDWAGTPADVMVAMIRARGGVVLMHMHGLHTAEAIRTL
jgi:peptidoglycan-N-acetylglucosamine deacetylase